MNQCRLTQIVREMIVYLLFKDKPPVISGLVSYYFDSSLQ